MAGVLAARTYYYEVVMQIAATSKPNEYIIRFDEDPQMYAVQIQPRFVGVSFEINLQIR